MTQFDNTNTGVLFRNDQAGNDKRPNYKGKVNVAGVDYELAGWTRTGASGVPFLSLKVQTPRPKPQATQQVRHERAYARAVALRRVSRY